MAAVQPAHAQGPTGGWSASPCDAQGNLLTNPLLRNGFYQMGGTKSGIASNTYPADWVASLGNNPPSGGASPLTVTTIPTMYADPSVGIAGYPTYGSFASNELTNGSIYYTTPTSSGLINGSVTTHIDGQLVYYFLVQWSGGGAPTSPLPTTISLLLNTNLVANVQLNYGSSKQTSGLSASASAADKAFNETASSTGPTSVIGYHLVQASVSPLTATTGIAETYLNGTVDQTANDPIPAGAYVAGHGYQPPNGSAPAIANSTTASANSEVSAGVKPFNIQLVQPDPNTDPTLGMGTTNQYVYSADTPDGYLYVPGAIQVVGGTHADAQMLLDNNLVDLKIETSPIPNTFVHQWAISGNTIYVNTPQNTDNPYPGYQFNHWIFKGLPSSFSTVADGNHNVNLYVQGAKTQTAKIQTFFNAGASNWPNSDSTTPNWYEYYNQAYSSSEFYGAYDPNITYPMAGYCTAASIYSPGSPDMYDVTNVGTYLGASAIANPVLPVFALRKRSDNLQYTTLIGELHVAGIHSYLRTYFEEIAHGETYVNRECLPPDRSAYNPAVLDSDNDGVPDSLERKFGLDPQNSDTTGYYSHYANVGLPGDNEVLAAIIALKYLLQKKSLWQQDWADSGLQYGTRPPYNCATSRNIFPWFYRSIESPNLPDSQDIPADALTDLPSLSN